MRILGSVGLGCLLVTCVAAGASAQSALTWAEVRARFEANNPTVQAGRLGIDESRADEVTAYLKPNPQFSVTADTINLFRSPSGSGLLDNMVTVAEFDYMHERAHKRELRRDSAVAATVIATSTQADLVRTLRFTLRGAFVQVLQAKSFLTLAQGELSDYDQVLGVSRDRLQAGDIAQIDFDRLTLQRVQYESDVQTAQVNLRTAKIQLLGLMNDRATPVEQFDVTGPYDFAPPGQPLDQVRQTALDARPDLKAALQAVDKAKTDHRLAIANGSTDPTFSVDAGWPQQPADFSPPVNSYVGVGVSIPLRIFDRNQGEKLKTNIDIGRSERLADANLTQVLSDVDSAYATVLSTIALLHPYKDTYLDQSLRVRDTMTFSYQSGGASLVDFLQAQQDYRSVQIAYVNLIASYLNAVSQLNFAVGQEAIQ
jgi:cobalt-zinc-cadmium efflux system outer membrane protein